MSAHSASLARPVIVIGSGGHAGVLIETIRQLGGMIRGIADADPSTHGKTRHGHPILGGDDSVLATPPNEVLLVNAIGSVGDMTFRRKIFERFKNQGFTFATLVHPSVIMASDVRLDEGVQVMAGAILQNGVHIGLNTLINTGAMIDHDGEIGAHSHIAPGVIFSGGVALGAENHIGTGACFAQGVKTGKNVTVGAGSVVLKDLPDHVIAFGVPARIQKDKA